MEKILVFLPTMQYCNPLHLSQKSLSMTPTESVSPRAGYGFILVEWSILCTWSLQILMLCRVPTWGNSLWGAWGFSCLYHQIIQNTSIKNLSSMKTCLFVFKVTCGERQWLISVHARWFTPLLPIALTYHPWVSSLPLLRQLLVFSTLLLKRVTLGNVGS